MQNSIRSTYSGLYEPSPNNRPIANEYKTFSKAWGWYKIIDDMANGEILRYDAVTSLPVTEVFTHLQYKKDKDYAEEMQRNLDRKIAKTKSNADS